MQQRHNKEKDFCPTFPRNDETAPAARGVGKNAAAATVLQMHDHRGHEGFITLGNLFVNVALQIKIGYTVSKTPLIKSVGNYSLQIINTELYITR